MQNVALTPALRALNSGLDSGYSDFFASFDGASRLSSSGPTPRLGSSVMATPRLSGQSSSRGQSRFWALLRRGRSALSSLIKYATDMTGEERVLRAKMACCELLLDLAFQHESVVRKLWQEHFFIDILQDLRLFLRYPRIPERRQLELEYVILLVETLRWMLCGVPYNVECLELLKYRPPFALADFVAELLSDVTVLPNQPLKDELMVLRETTVSVFVELTFMVRMASVQQIPYRLTDLMDAVAAHPTFRFRRLSRFVKHFWMLFDEQPSNERVVAIFHFAHFLSSLVKFSLSLRDFFAIHHAAEYKYMLNSERIEAILNGADSLPLDACSRRLLLEMQTVLSDTATHVAPKPMRGPYS